MATSILNRLENVRADTVSHPCLSICLVGGIYGKDAAYQEKFTMVPETLLADALRQRGHLVTTQGHRSMIDARNVDIIHVHHLGIAGLAAATDMSTAAFVYTSHDGSSMAGISDTLSHRFANQFVMSRADAVVALSNAEKKFQSRNYPLKNAVHLVIPNGIDATNYHYLRTNTAGVGRPWKILFVGQLIEIKGVERLIRAIALLPRDIELSLAYHCDTLRDRLENLVRNLGLQNHVSFLGSKTPEELRTLYQSSDVFALPSFAEALPSVVTEAMLCGTPVVATDVGGIREQLGGYGCVVPPRDIGELAKALRNVLAHYSEFSERGEAMSRYAAQRFSISTMVDRHIDLYKSLLKGKQMRHRNERSKLPMNMLARFGVRVLCRK